MNPADAGPADSGSASPFVRRPPERDGILLGLDGRGRRLPPAQRSNHLVLTARFYEPLWRHRSLALLTRGAYTTARELALMRRWLAPQPGERALDAACSSALYARALHAEQPELELHAVDLSEPFLRVARERAAAEGVPLTLLQADVQALPYRDAAFDLVACGGSLNEFLDLEAALRELARVLRPGGRLWLMYVARAESWPGRALQGTLQLSGLRFPAAERVTAVAGAAGLHLVRAEHRRPLLLTLLRRSD